MSDEHGRGAPRKPGGCTVALINELRDPLDVLILQGEGLVERLRRAPLRRIAVLGERADRVLSMVIKVDALLGEMATAMDGDAK